ncbi:MAG TPA: Hsp20/alpha crystallin family protein [Candidatus Saccharimonadales bacterium]|nr:Hsp20/alpha crystallin family protein [Candidatus Saccharimonadales bacterium]
MKRTYDLEQIRDHMEHLLSGRPHLPLPGHAAWHPPTDAYETEAEFVVRVDIAGARREDLSVVADGRVLRIRGVRRSLPSEGRPQFHKMEIRMGVFERHLRLPEGCGCESFSIDYQEGILVVRVAKGPGRTSGPAGPEP